MSEAQAKAMIQDILSCLGVSINTGSPEAMDELVDVVDDYIGVTFK